MIHRLLRTWKNGYYRRCEHRSHRLHLRCYRGFVTDGYCDHHNDTCFFQHGFGFREAYEAQAEALRQIQEKKDR